MVCVSVSVTGGPAGSALAHPGTLGTTTSQPPPSAIVAGAMALLMTVAIEAKAVRAVRGNVALPEVAGPQQMDVVLPLPAFVGEHWATRESLRAVVAHADTVVPFCTGFGARDAVQPRPATAKTAAVQ